MKTVTEITVRNYHIDNFGHVNHARYVELLEEARWRYLEENHLLGPIHSVNAFHVVAEIVIQYRRAAHIGDILHIETHIDRRSEQRFWVDQKIFLKASDKIVLKAVIANVFIDEKGRPKKINSTVLDVWPDLTHAKFDPSFTPCQG